jgi:hypothetical protein
MPDELNDWWEDRTALHRQRLRDLCDRLIKQALERAEFPIVLRQTAREAAQTFVETHVLTYEGESWSELTDDFIADGVPKPFASHEWSCGHYRLQAFADYIEARTSFLLLLHAPIEEHRERAARLLVRALWGPITRSAWRELGRRHVPASRKDWIIPEIQNSFLSGDNFARLVRAWVRRPPARFPDALAYARRAAENAARDVRRRRRRELLVEDLPNGLAENRPSAEHETCTPVPIQEDFDSSLLDALYPLAWRAALDLGPVLSVLPLLMLGGISHRANPSAPWGEVPRLVQTPLIDALKRRLGPQFIRDYYQGRVARLMEAGLLEVIHAKFLSGPFRK